MACEGQIHLGDVGTVFRITLYNKQCDGTTAILDVSGATTIQLVFKPPASASVTKTATFTTDGTDGQIEYTTIANDLSETGKWKLQAYVVLPSGSWRSEIVEFTVYENL